MSSLPAHASMATLGYEAAGKRFPKRDNNIPKGLGLGGMVNIGKLSVTYRHARKCESC